MLWKDFLESVPPGEKRDIDDLCQPNFASGRGSGIVGLLMRMPDIHIYCDECQGVRSHHCVNSSFGFMVEHKCNKIFEYKCRNCMNRLKTIAVGYETVGPTIGVGKAWKLGEWPPFGPHVPSRVISLIGPDRDLFLKGRRSESQGLGVGAFAYYRQVVENQFGRLIAEIEKVAKRIGATDEMIITLNRAAKERQFAKAVDDTKNLIPDAIKINGHNPLLLLHSALSKGIHGGTDAECLELATDIREVLTELSERITTALKENGALEQSLSRLLNQKPKTEGS